MFFNLAQVQVTSQITWSFQIFHTIQITCFYSPMQRFWLVWFLCAHNDQSERTRISRVTSSVWNVSGPVSHLSRGEKIEYRQTCCILKLVGRKLSRAKVKYDVTQGLLQALILLVRWSPRIIRQSNVKSWRCHATLASQIRFVTIQIMASTLLTLSISQVINIPVSRYKGR